MAATPVFSSVKKRSEGRASELGLVARVLGTAVRRDHVRPPSVVLSTLPLSSMR
jgi:hypothetical protein